MQELLDLSYTEINEIIGEIMANNNFERFDEFLEELQNVVPSATLNADEIQNVEHFNYVKFDGRIIYFDIFDVINVNNFVQPMDNGTDNCVRVNKSESESDNEYYIVDEEEEEEDLEQ